MLLVGSGQSEAQVVEGVVVEQGSEQPVGQATVGLVDRAGERVRSTVTDRAGRFVLAAPTPGTYRLEAEHLSYATAETEPFQIEAGATVEVTVRMDPDALPLEALEVEGRRMSLLRQEASYEGFYARHAESPSVGSNRAIGPDDPFWDDSMTVRQFLRYVWPPGGCPDGSVYYFYQGRQVSPIGWNPPRPIHAWIQAIGNMTLAELEGIEVYTRQTSAPLDLRGATGLCLGVTVWPKRVWEPEARAQRAELAGENPFGAAERLDPEAREEQSRLRSAVAIAGLTSLLTGLFLVSVSGR